TIRLWRPRFCNCGNAPLFSSCWDHILQRSTKTSYMTADTIAVQSPEYVRRIAPYAAGKPIEELAREYGLPVDSIIKLASNENPRGPSPSVRRAIADATMDITRYPDSNGFALKAAL